MQISKILSLFAFFFILSNAYAQPEHAGCRHAHHGAFRMAPTLEEKAIMRASAERSDTIDVLDYTIDLNVTNFSSRTINANCIVTFASKLDGVDYINLDLQTLTVDSVMMQDVHLDYQHNGLLLRINLPNALQAGEQTAVRVYYQGTPDTDVSDFGGFDFVGGYAYNLGIGLTSNPPNFGRSWFPCFDNFVERTTYEFQVTSTLPNRAYCVGSFIGEELLEDNLVRRTYQMSKPIPTYLASVAISNYTEANGMHEGIDRMIPTQLVAIPSDIEAMESTFIDLGKAIDALEYWYGPYEWERVGYVATPVGAMEHPTNIAYPISSAIGGNTFGHRRLMAHELAHCWWGDVVTVGEAREMWVKEGNAEYGAHLMTEFAFGYEAFIDQVKDNHLEEVLTAAHIDDDGFHPLSQIPFEHIYGTTTYRKGASMLHNMRGYLGDSLFRQGQRAVLEKYRFASADAIQYRDELIEATGYDMTHFFNDWIMNPGFSAFEPKHNYAPNGQGYDVDLTLTQKVRAAPSLHTNVPLEITFIDREGNKDMQQVVASGAETTYNLTSTVEPVWVTVNENNTLNMAHLSHQTMLDEDSNSNQPYVDIAFNVEAASEPTFVHIDHYWVAPDPIENNPDNAQISSTHYWRIIGELDNGIELKATLEYKKFLDLDLVGDTEEDLILIYRPNKNSDWKEYPYYNKVTLVPTDGNGFISMQRVLEGEYTFANGSLPLYTSTDDVKTIVKNVNVYPNPASSNVALSLDLENTIQTLYLKLLNVEGKTILQKTINPSANTVEELLNVGDMPVGAYWLHIMDEKQHILNIQTLEVIR